MDGASTMTSADVSGAPGGPGAPGAPGAWAGAVRPRAAGEPTWLAEQRGEAARRFEALGFPTTRDEDWRYTDVRAIARARFEAPRPEAAAAIDVAALAPYLLGGADAIRLVLVDGRLAPGLSALGGLPAGVEVRGLAEALAHGGPEALGQGLTGVGGAFAALNGARFQDGAVVRVAPRVALARPIHIVHVTSAGAGPTECHPRVLLTVGREAHATVIESYVGLGGAASLTNAVTEVALGDGARLEHVKVEREGRAAFHVATWTARLGRDARLRSLNLSLGGALVRNDIVVTLAGTGGDARIDGLVVAGGARHVDNHTRIEHDSAHCRSFEVYKHVLAGRARGVFNGAVLVRPNAQKTDAKQENRSLLLSDEAVIDSKPQLEIFADDVKCTHGATVGQLDANARFYLMARGIDRATADRLLTYAFAAEVVESFEQEAVREALREVVQGALERVLASGAGPEVQG